MKGVILQVVFFLVVFSAQTQELEGVVSENSEQVGDTKYREDQFYAGFSFNLLLNRPVGVKQSGFSGGVHLGFIRDMPINKQRNIAIGLGLGYSGNTFNQNLGITKLKGFQETVFEAKESGSFTENRFTTHLIEVPLEFRWRTSRPTELKFWRIYTGMRLGYLYRFRSTLKTDEGTFVKTEFNELDRIRLGATFTFGWNTFNFHFYYSLNSFFNTNARLVPTGEAVGVNTLKIGLLFYIL